MLASLSRNAVLTVLGRFESLTRNNSDVTRYAMYEVTTNCRSKTHPKITTLSVFIYIWGSANGILPG